MGYPTFPHGNFQALAFRLPPEGWVSGKVYMSGLITTMSVLQKNKLRQSYATASYYRQ